MGAVTIFTAETTSQSTSETIVVSSDGDVSTSNATSSAIQPQATTTPETTTQPSLVDTTTDDSAEDFNLLESPITDTADDEPATESEEPADIVNSEPEPSTPEPSTPEPSTPELNASTDTADNSSIETVAETDVPDNDVPTTAEPITDAIDDAPFAATATGFDVAAFHRNGQTFVTWDEDTSVHGEQYHIYRSANIITAANLSAATRITDAWGPLDDDTSVHQLAGDGAPTHFVIEDFGEPLDDDTGLFVYTTQAGEEGLAYYAVTTVIDGVEQIQSLGTLTPNEGVTESTGESAPILVTAINNGLGRVYTHFMDYTDWNPTFQGYAYNYAVALPSDYDPSQEYELKLILHAYGERHNFIPQTQYDWNAIEVFVDDPGTDRDTIHTWWYGFAADHNYTTDGDIPTAGTIENFTQQRVLKAISEVANEFTVDEDLIHIQGNSMGASGALSFGIHYGQVFSAIYASQPMTNYATSPGFQDNFVELWGTQADNLTIVNDGLYADTITQYGAGGASPTGVWDWLNHGVQRVARGRVEVL